MDFLPTFNCSLLFFTSDNILVNVENNPLAFFPIKSKSLSILSNSKVQFFKTFSAPPKSFTVFSILLVLIFAKGSGRGLSKDSYPFLICFNKPSTSLSWAGVKFLSAII